MEWITPELMALLFAAGLAAGWIDAIAGGGGLIGLPVLLAAGLPPLPALATNKLQGSFGAFAATLHYARAGEIELRRAWPEALAALSGSLLGAWLVQGLDTAWLQRLIPLLLAAFALYFLLSPRVGDLDSQRRLGHVPFALLVGGGVGFYDGFFGPGTGSLFAAAYVALAGYNLRRATAHTKLLNLASNLAALGMFTAAGLVVWPAGLAMAAGQLIGARLGAGTALKHGAAVIRPLLVIVSLAICVKLLLG
ncbi:TSUP family transporter [Endothiovibrio diazotrophicus]